jgi:prevent-host-death family protein
MKNVNVSELRQNLRAYLTRAGSGERIRVTSRGKTIAELAPPSRVHGAAEAARARLRGSVIRFDRPLDPVISDAESEMNR